MLVCGIVKVPACMLHLQAALQLHLTVQTMFVWPGQAIKGYMHTKFITNSMTTTCCVDNLHGLHVWCRQKSRDIEVDLWRFEVSE